ncbi:ubiquitination network signaling protein [Ophiostoma piceae UAMH 11346]|uniref:Ubiquitination network signaling protein n=1 Tax=Ophiostoma piceae (strain UAMH 11346) TaxID=1262450 RepID=S3CPX2_OPHP1|nr:ubiquitination network signaling protein [Ophiostoma piceae UAMH 11346]
MPRASPSAKRQPGAASNQRDNNRNDNGLGSNGKRVARNQHKSSANGSPSPGGNAVARPSTSAGIPASSAQTSSATNAPCSSSSSSSPPHLLAAAAVAAAANGCTREGDIMASPSNTAAYTSHPQRHRNSDPTGSSSPSSGPGRRSHGVLSAADRHHLANAAVVDNASSNLSPASTTDAAAVSHHHVFTPPYTSSTPGPSAALAVSFDDSHRRIDVNAAKNSNVHRDTGPFDLAFTILRSCPLYDTIAILIILMQLSPVVLSIIYVLFTLLTFVPPVTTSSGLSLTEMFEGGLGTPAFTTTVCMDICLLLVWLFLWRPLQLLILDFAQIVIALTLGGGCNGNSSRQGSANNIFVCLGIILFSHVNHVFSFENIPHLGPLFAADHSPIFADQHSTLYTYSRFFSRRSGGVSWLRNLFAIHILTQGIVRYVREWYLRREKRDSASQSLVDPEAGKGTYMVETPMEANFPSNAGDNDGAHPGAGGTASGSDPTSGHHATGFGTNGPGGSSASNGNAGMGSSPSLGSSDPDPSSSTATTSLASTAISANHRHVAMRKKKKQSALVRLRQPLWAALASTKIVMIKEYELSQAASESAGAEATDVDNLGNAPFYSQPGQIWVCYVGHDEVCFSTSEFPSETAGQKHANALSSLPNTSYIDTSKPFYVRINNARWQPTRILRIITDGDEERIETEPPPSSEVDSRCPSTPSSSSSTAANPSRPSTSLSPFSSPFTRWTGDIYGLTPLSSYEIEFVSTRTNEVIFSTSVRTAVAPFKNVNNAITAAKTAQPTPGQLRPHESPATTIRASIAMQEDKLNSEKSRFKTLRKDNNRRINVLKKEIERLNASVQSSGGNDEKLKQKITQNTVQQRQAEQAIEEVDNELKGKSTIPEDLLAQHRNKKSEWDREKAQYDGAMASFKSFKNLVDAEIRSLKDEEATYAAKKSKIAARIAKAENEHAQITDANTRGLDEAERRRQERVNLENEIARAQQNYNDRLMIAQAINAEKVRTIEALHETMRSFYSSFDAERPYDTPYAMGTVSAAAPVMPVATAGIGGLPASTPGSFPSTTPHTSASTLFVPPTSLWHPVSAMPSTGHSPAASHITPGMSGFMSSLYASPVPPMPLRMRGRSSSMLSDVSGFTQSSTADDDNIFMPGSNFMGNPSFQNVNGSLGGPSTVPTASLAHDLLQTGTIRGPSGLNHTLPRRSSGSASASGSSVGCGSGSTGSGREPASPV